MKTIITIILLIQLLSVVETDNSNSKETNLYYEMYENAYRGVLKFRFIKKKDEVSKRYAKSIMKFTKKYNLPDARKIDIQIFGESRYNPYARGDYDGEKYNSFGCAQIMMKYHIGKLYKVNDGKLGKYFKTLEKEGKKINYERYLYNIEYNIEVQCMYMSKLLRKYKNYEIALLGYGCGENSDAFKKYKNYKKIPLKYIRNIMDKKI